MLFSDRKTDSNNFNYITTYKAVSFNKEKKFPILVSTKEEMSEGENKLQNSSSKQSPNAINLRLPELVKMMHGSFESKSKIFEDFHQKFSECTKKSILLKMRELFEKDKKGQDPRQRWYATESTLIENNLQDDEELKLLFKERLQQAVVEAAKVKEEQQKLKEEKKVEKLQQKNLNLQEPSATLI